MIPGDKNNVDDNNNSMGSSCEDSSVLGEEEECDKVLDWDAYFKSLHQQFEENHRKEINNKLVSQLKELRNKKHREHTESKHRRVLVASESIMYQMEERRLKYQIPGVVTILQR